MTDNLEYAFVSPKLTVCGTFGLHICFLHQALSEHQQQRCRMSTFTCQQWCLPFSACRVDLVHFRLGRWCIVTGICCIVSTEILCVSKRAYSKSVSKLYASYCVLASSWSFVYICTFVCMYVLFCLWELAKTLSLLGGVFSMFMKLKVLVRW